MLIIVYIKINVSIDEKQCRGSIFTEYPNIDKSQFFFSRFFLFRDHFQDSCVAELFVSAFKLSLFSSRAKEYAIGIYFEHEHKPAHNDGYFPTHLATKPSVHMFLC